MNEDIKEKIKLILDPSRPQPVFSEDDVITLDLVDYIRGMPSHANIHKLFIKPTRFGARQQKVEERCCDCGKVFVAIKNMNECIAYLSKSVAYRCPDCQKRVDQEQEAVQSISREISIKQRQERTDRYINTFLDPQRTWKDGIKTWEKLRDLSDDVDFDKIAAYIQEMDYHHFLATPYWQAIAEKVKNKNDWRCEICGKQSYNLNVHHPNYDFHGYELQNIAKLKCLCKDCHEKFHKE